MVMLPMLALLIYQPFAVLFALVTLIRSYFRDIKNYLWMGVLVLIVSFMTIIYQGRLVFEIAWALIPIWALASVEVGRHIKFPHLPLVVSGQAGLIIILSILFWQISLRPQLGNLTWVVLLIIPIIVVFSVVLIGLGWTWNAAKEGVVLGIILILNIFLISIMFRVSFAKQNKPSELWTPKPGPGQIHLLEKTLNNLALLHSGREDSIPILSLVDAPSLVWILRNFPNTTISDQITK